MSLYASFARAFLLLALVELSKCASVDPDAGQFHNLGISPAIQKPEGNRSTSSAQERLFTLLRFHPEVCEINPTGGMGVGTCTTSTDCTNRGGSNIGSCAKGFGVCCLITLSATPQNPIVTVRDKAVIIENGNGATMSTFEFPRLEGSCQLLVEFLVFTLAIPNLGTGVCTESMRISGSVTVDTGFPICGANTGQRIYLSYGRQERITMEFNTAAAGRYQLRVRHIQCTNTAQLAPVNCLQYYTTSTGIVRSFSYGMSMVAGQHYTVCIQDPSSSRGIEWSECLDTDPGATALLSQFHLSNYFTQKVATVPPIRMPMNGWACEETSYVEVFGETKHCGAKFNFETMQPLSPIKSEAKPYQLFVKTTQNAYVLPIRTPPLVQAPFEYPITTGNPNPPITPCNMLGATTGGQGFGTCAPTDMAHICACPLITPAPIIPIDPALPPRSGFCLKYMLM